MFKPKSSTMELFSLQTKQRVDVFFMSKKMSSVIDKFSSGKRRTYTQPVFSITFINDFTSVGNK